MSIFFNNSSINDWYYNSSDIIKVYHNGAVCYYKLDSSSPSGQTPCFAVVDDITQYTETEFEDVFDKATEKWYKLNNLNQYEEYGVYASGRTICEGSTSRLPQGYTEVEYIRHSNDVRVQNVWSVPNDAVDGNIYTVDLLLDSTSQQGQSRFIGLFGWGSGHCQRTNRTAGDQTNAGYHCSDGWHGNDTIGNYYQEYDVKLRYRMTTSALTITNTQTSAVTTLDFTVHSGSATGGNFGVFSYTGSDSGAYQMRGNIYQIIIEGSDNTIKHQYIPCQRNSDSQYGLYDLIGEEFYYPTTITISGGSAVTPTDCVTTYEGKLTIDEEATSRLPQGYTEVEYIENTSYVANTKSTTRFNVIGDSSSGNIYTIVYDLYDDSGSRYLHIFGNNVNVFMQKIQQVWADKCIHFKFYGLDAYAVSTPLSTKAQIEIDSNSIIITNLEASTSTTTTYGGSITSVNETHYGVFCCYNNNDNGAHSMVGKIYEIKIESSNHELKNHYIPCYRDSDNKVGLYDIVGDAFYYDESGELSLSGGEPVTPTSTTCEFIYSGDSWVNVGEVSGSTIETIWLDPSATNALFSIGHYWGENYKIVFTTYLSGSYSGDYGSFWKGNGHTPIELSFYSNGFYYDMHNPTSTTAPDVRTTDYDFRILKTNAFSNYQNSQVMEITLTYGSFKAELEETGAVIYSSGSTRTGYSWYSGLYQANIGLDNANSKCHLSHIKVYNENDVLVNDIKFIKNPNVTGSQELSMYDSILDATYNNTNSNTPTYHIVEDGTAVEYPIYYDEMQDPPNNLVFSSMTEAESYECPWVGMKATIDGSGYTFTSAYTWEYTASRLPVGYTEVEYIQNTGTSYLNTNFVPNQDTRVVMQYQMVTDSGAGRLWGAGAWNSANGIEPNYEAGYLGISWFGNTSWTRYNNFPADYNKHLLDLNKNYLYLDETLVGSNTYTTRTASDPIGVFTYIGSGRPSSSSYWGIEHFKGKMFSFQIYDNGTLIRDLVPCIRDNDNTVGAYDIVNDVFYTVPSGYTTDKLVAGSPI